MSDLAETRYRVPADVHSRRFAGELVILDLSRGVYYALEGIGVDIWEQLASGRSAREVIEELGSTYDVAMVRLQEDVDRLTHELCDVGLLERAERDHGH